MLQVAVQTLYICFPHSYLMFMINQKPSASNLILSGLFAATVLISFFLPWVKWSAVGVSAKDMATGNFYKLSETNFGLGNPFPEMAFANAFFWLIPILALLVILMLAIKKSYATFLGALTGAIVLGLAVVYALFTNELNMFDPAIQLPAAMQPAFYMAVLSAIGLIMCSWPQKWGLKIFFMVAPLAFSYFAFTQIKKSQLTEKVAETNTLKAAFKVNAPQLIQEFVTADSLANAKYREQIIEVTGVISELNAKDSTSTLSMADSTGSYVIFDFEKEQASKVQTLKVGDYITVKGLCSGSIFSEIMGTQTISFKHAILNN